MSGGCIQEFVPTGWGGSETMLFMKQGDYLATVSRFCTKFRIICVSIRIQFCTKLRIHSK